MQVPFFILVRLKSLIVSHNAKEYNQNSLTTNKELVMPNLIVTYDLRKQRDYKALIDAIKTYGTYAKVFESVWYIRSATHSAEQCRNYLQKFI